MHFVNWERHANAYLLFYERVHPKLVAEPEACEEPKADQALPLVDNQDVIMAQPEAEDEVQPLPQLTKTVSINSMEQPLYEHIKA